METLTSVLQRVLAALREREQRAAVLDLADDAVRATEVADIPEPTRRVGAGLTHG